MENLRIYREINAIHETGEAAALAVLVQSSGSAPRKAGAKMLVRRDGSSTGTIGGGKVEMETVEAARAVIELGVPRTISFMLTENYGHVCGGSLLVYIEPIIPPPRLVVLGAGHVGRALITAASFAGFYVLLADERREYVHEAGAEASFIGEPAAALDHFAIDSATAIAIATPRYDEDFAAVRAALATPAFFIGLIGSRRKKEVLERTLREEGYDDEAISRVMIPVGLAIGAETPEEIAVSITAQLIRSRRRDGGTNSGDPAGGRQVESHGPM